MKFTSLFAVAVALSTTNATFLKGMGGMGGYGGSSGGSTGGSTGGTVETTCGEACGQPCEQGCEASATTSGGYTQTGSGEATTSQVPTDIKSQIIGAISQFLETSFSGSGAMISNLIG